MGLGERICGGRGGGKEATNLKLDGVIKFSYFARVKKLIFCFIILLSHILNYTHETHEKCEKLFSVFCVFSGPRKVI